MMSNHPLNALRKTSMTLQKRGLLVLLATSLPIWAGSESVPGIENFHQVDQNVYRGAQPSDEGFRYLASIGVKVVVDLREHDSRSAAEEKSVNAAGMQYVNVPMTGLTPPTADETARILAILENGSAGPAFVHCKRGADRTGAVIAAYRIDHDKWDNVRALAEAKSNHMSPFQIPRQNYIRAFQPLAQPAAAPAIAAAATAVKN
jgi:protein tyrosine/serine phosphatase